MSSHSRRVFLKTIAVSAGTAAFAENCSTGPSPMDSGLDASPTDAGADAADAQPDVSAVDVPTPNCDAGTALFTDDQRRALAALCDSILPPDADPGASGLGAVNYIETFLNAFENGSAVPPIWAGGPFSGRTPYPAPTGGVPSNIFPPNQFAQFIPLTRSAEFAFRLRIYGSAGMPNGGPNDAVLGPTTGWRTLFQTTLCQVLQQQPAIGLEPIAPDVFATLWANLPMEFTDALVQLTLEGVFAAPEYGGNTNTDAWSMVFFEGDHQPLGFSIFDPSINDYRELASAPVSTANPFPDPLPMDSETIALITEYVHLLGGRIAG